MSESTNSVYHIEPLCSAENFGVWKIKMLDILTDLSLDDYIDKNTSEPSDAAARATWKKNDRKALSTIRLRVADNVLVYVSGAKTALEAWTSLSNMYEAKGPIGIVSARRKFFRAQCPEEGDIEEHIWTMHSYQDELATLGQTISKSDFSTSLLTSLPDSWNSFISSITDDLIKDSSKVIARVLAEAARLRDCTSASTALPAIDRSSTNCFNCGKKGHFANECRSLRNQSDSQLEIPTSHQDSGYP